MGQIQVFWDRCLGTSTFVPMNGIEEALTELEPTIKGVAKHFCRLVANERDMSFDDWCQFFRIIVLEKLDTWDKDKSKIKTYFGNLFFYRGIDYLRSSRFCGGLTGRARKIVKREQLTYESEGESSQVIRFDVEKAESKSTQEHDRDVAYEHHSRWLTPREKEIFSLIFVENQTQTDVARKLGISEARVSHIMQNQILEKVRLSIATEIIDD